MPKADATRGSTPVTSPRPISVSPHAIATLQMFVAVGFSAIFWNSGAAIHRLRRR